MKVNKIIVEKHKRINIKEISSNKVYLIYISLETKYKLKLLTKKKKYYSSNEIKNLIFFVNAT